MQKCNRCNTKMGKIHDGWVKCPKCGLSQFVGQKTVQKDAENNSQPLPSPTHKKGKKSKSKAK